MHTKKLLLLTMTILFVASAAFFTGILVNRKVNPDVLSTDLRSIMIPALELPTTPPDVTGSFIDRQDQTLILESRSLGADGPGAFSISPQNQSGPRVEVVVTGETKIYRETTEAGEPISAENQTIQQTVEAAALDGINPACMVRVWGHERGDRIIAEVMVYSHTVQIKRAIFEDCQICP